MTARIVLITGGNRGLGRAYAEALTGSKHPYKIAITARSADAARATARAIGAHVTGYGCDIEDPEAVERLRADIEKDYGRVDVLINNAGVALDEVAHSGPLTIEQQRTAWTRSFAINVTATHFFTHALAPLLLRSSAPMLVFISSLVGSIASQHAHGIPFFDDAPPAGWPKTPEHDPAPSAYRSSKAGGNMMAREWAKRLENDGVKTYILAMTGYATELGGQDPEAAKKGGKEGAEVAAEWVRGFVEGEHEGEEGLLMSREGQLAW